MEEATPRGEAPGENQKPVSGQGGSAEERRRKPTGGKAESRGEGGPGLPMEWRGRRGEAFPTQGGRVKPHRQIMRGGEEN